VNDALPWALLPAAVTALVIAILRRTSFSRHLADHPNERSLHSQPRPRIGGLGIAAGIFPLGLYATGGSIALILACALGLALVSLIDDLRSLPVAVRLAAHGIAAIVVMAVIAFLPTGVDALRWVTWLAGVAALARITNLYNFMDGADGLAGTMALVGFGAYALAATFAGKPTLAYVCLSIASASAGFLVHNLPPARVFMGDAGSITLGFLAGALGLYGFMADAWPAAFPVVVFSPFIVDATVTLF
jgi:UDP-N-acetylmuramyl pentapeptide phosphotransferase/UDP-N-acetylglucosamine-1-phosphate transferase